MKSLKILSVIVVCGLFFYSWSATVIDTFQNGLHGYKGCDDAYFENIPGVESMNLYDEALQVFLYDCAT